MDRPVRHRREQPPRINRRQQGDLGELSAMNWLAYKGAVVWLPFGHSPDIDLIAQLGDFLLRIQVKTTTLRVTTSAAGERWATALATNGGNQSWSGVSKTFDPRTVDFLFVLVGDGRRWFIPSSAVEGRRSVRLGGPRYSEFEVEPGDPITSVVYEGQADRPTIEDPARGSAGVGEPGSAVNRVPQLLRGFESLLPHPPARPDLPPRPRLRPSRYERKAGKNGQAVINQKRRVTLPQQALLDAGLRDGDWVTAHADGSGRIVLEKAGLPVWAEPELQGPSESEGAC